MTRGNTKFITFLYVQERTHYEKGSVKEKKSPRNRVEDKKESLRFYSPKHARVYFAIITHYFFFFLVKKLRMIYLFLEYVLSVGAIHVIKEKNNLC